jgi:hypothetical protein
MSSDSPIYCFREITDKWQLEQALLKRRNYFVNVSNIEIDLDEYDLFARHYALILQIGGQDNIVGYIRIVWDSDEQFNQSTIEHLQQKYQLASPRKRAPFDAYNVFGAQVFQVIKQDFSQLHQQACILCEPDCLFIDPAYRSFRLMQFMIECAMVVICSHPVLPFGLVNVAERHHSLYARNGFERYSSIASRASGTVETRYLMGISYYGVKNKLPDLKQRIKDFECQKGFVLNQKA